MTSLVLSDSSQLTADGFEKLPDQIMYFYAEPYDLQKHRFNVSVVRVMKTQLGSKMSRTEKRAVQKMMAAVLQRIIDQYESTSLPTTLEPLTAARRDNSSVQSGLELQMTTGRGDSSLPTRLEPQITTGSVLSLSLYISTDSTLLPTQQSSLERRHENHSEKLPFRDGNDTNDLLQTSECVTSADCGIKQIRDGLPSDEVKVNVVLSPEIKNETDPLAGVHEPEYKLNIRQLNDLVNVKSTNGERIKDEPSTPTIKPDRDKHSKTIKIENYLTSYDKPCLPNSRDGLGEEGIANTAPADSSGGVDPLSGIRGLVDALKTPDQDLLKSKSQNKGTEKQFENLSGQNFIYKNKVDLKNVAQNQNICPISQFDESTPSLRVILVGDYTSLNDNTSILNYVPQDSANVTGNMNTSMELPPLVPLTGSCYGVGTLPAVGLQQDMLLPGPSTVCQQDAQLTRSVVSQKDNHVIGPTVASNQSTGTGMQILGNGLYVVMGNFTKEVTTPARAVGEATMPQISDVVSLAAIDGSTSSGSSCTNYFSHKDISFQSFNKSSISESHLRSPATVDHQALTRSFTMGPTVAPTESVPKAHPDESSFSRVPMTPSLLNIVQPPTSTQKMMVKPTLKFVSPDIYEKNSPVNGFFKDPGGILGYLGEGRDASGLDQSVFSVNVNEGWYYNDTLATMYTKMWSMNKSHKFYTVQLFTKTNKYVVGLSRRGIHVYHLGAAVSQVSSFAQLDDLITNYLNGTMSDGKSLKQLVKLILYDIALRYIKCRDPIKFESLFAFGLGKCYKFCRKNNSAPLARQGNRVGTRPVPTSRSNANTGVPPNESFMNYGREQSNGTNGDSGDLPSAHREHRDRNSKHSSKEVIERNMLMHHMHPSLGNVLSHPSPPLVTKTPDRDITPFHKESSPTTVSEIITLGVKQSIVKETITFDNPCDEDEARTMDDSCDVDEARTMDKNPCEVEETISPDYLCDSNASLAVVSSTTQPKSPLDKDSPSTCNITFQDSDKVMSSDDDILLTDSTGQSSSSAVEAVSSTEGPAISHNILATDTSSDFVTLDMCVEVGPDPNYPLALASSSSDGQCKTLEAHSCARELAQKQTKITNKSCVKPVPNWKFKRLIDPLGVKSYSRPIKTKKYAVPLKDLKDSVCKMVSKNQNNSTPTTFMRDPLGFDKSTNQSRSRNNFSKFSKKNATFPLNDPLFVKASSMQVSVSKRPFPNNSVKFSKNTILPLKDPLSGKASSKQVSVSKISLSNGSANKQTKISDALSLNESLSTPQIITLDDPTNDGSSSDLQVITLDDDSMDGEDTVTPIVKPQLEELGGVSKKQPKKNVGTVSNMVPEKGGWNAAVTKPAPLPRANVTKSKGSISCVVIDSDDDIQIVGESSGTFDVYYELVHLNKLCMQDPTVVKTNNIFTALKRKTSSKQLIRLQSSAKPQYVCESCDLFYNSWHELVIHLSSHKSGYRKSVNVAKCSFRQSRNIFTEGTGCVTSAGKTSNVTLSCKPIPSSINKIPAVSSMGELQLQDLLKKTTSYLKRIISSSSIR
uniref:C2H2-type domain-containing protein n=1 Tax=Timema shepardi TaxID=629360 RepID=A0A7R9AX86_TIMSH|nr:unnamed protein product [Timema shepardi]